jgi:hypothetical protein
MNNKYKYITQFTTGQIKVCPILTEEKITRASLKNLTSLIPDQEVDLNENIDLLGVAFNAAVVNRFNKNDDGIDTETALRIAKLFKHKPTNIEHKKEKVVGHILTAGFSRYGDSQILTSDELTNYSEVFNISLGAVVYKFVNKEFASALQASSEDPSSEYYGKISTSWELGFNDYKIAIGSDNLKDAEIVSDEKQIRELKSKLKSYGGSGELQDGTKIYRLVVGEVYPLGIGFTTNPAADVNGIITNESEYKDSLNEQKAEVYEFKSHFFTKKNSQSKNIAVKSQKESPMNLDNLISEVKEALLEKKISQEAAANMTATFTEAIKKKDEEYRKDIETSKSLAEAAEKEKNELKASVDEIQQQLADALSKIEQFETERKAAEALARFNSRMQEIDEIFELDDEDRQVLAEDIKNLDETDEVFASYKNKLGVMWKNKNKKAKEEKDKEKEKEMKAAIDAEVEKRVSSLEKAATSTASVEEVLENVKASEAGLPNNNQESSKAQKSLFERFSEAFKKENITIS